MIYVDDMRVIAKVGRIHARWSHLIADTKTELHDFASSIGLQRSWFQDPMVSGKPLVTQPDCRAAQNWHYDVTDAKRAQAINRGAIEVSMRDMSRIIDERYARLFPQQAAELEARMAKIFTDMREGLEKR